MSIANSGPTNGRATKRQKTSHDSDEVLSESGASVDESQQGVAIPEIPGDQSQDEADNVDAPSPSARTTSIPRKPNPMISTTSTSSSTLMLQAQQLLNDIRPDHASRIRKLRPAVDRIIDLIKAMPAQQPMSYSQVQSYSQKTLRVTIPWSHRPAADIRYSFQFATPSKVTLGGSLVQHLTVRDSATTIVIVPEMPSETFQEKDHLNHRCLHKRAFYLACIAATLQKALAKEFDLSFTFRQDNELLPVLQLVAKTGQKFSGSATYEISPSFPETVGPVERMTPMHACIRKHDLVGSGADDLAKQTPFYNSTIRSLASLNHFHQLISDAATKADSFRDACLLGSTWLQQRHFSTSVADAGFGVEEWSIMSALLLKSGGHQGQPLFSPRYSTVQFFKAMLQVLSGRDMYAPFIVRGNIILGDKLSIPVFLDAVTGVNILYKMTPWSYARLKHDATLSLAALNSKKFNGFDATFTTKTTGPSLQYDEFYQLEGVSSSDSTSSSSEDLMKLYELLKKGLDDRARLINLASKSTGPWNITSSAPAINASKVTAAILINSETTARLVDHGPSVEEKEDAKAFRSFWGEKSELRKFKDGSICESLVWDEKTSVTQQIVQYLCARHLGLSHSNIRASASLQQLQLRSIVPAEEAFTAINTKFQTLSSTLHHLDGLPLPIRSVSSASESTHSSSLILPLEPGIAQPIDVVIQFDSSGRWPDNLQAIQYTKIAFLTKIGDLLIKQDRKLEARVGTENSSTSASGEFNTSYLDVIETPSAANLPPTIFRIRIYHERELYLIQQALSSNSVRPHDREKLQFALHYMKQNFIARSVHDIAIRSLITQFPPLSTTIRLFKSWISAHHLSQHINPESLELIAAHVFLSPAPWSTPGTATTAFTRCLHLLSKWDWSAQPLIVDLSPSQDMTLESRKDLENRFAAWRQMDPNMNTVTWFIGSNIDITGVIWTQGAGGSSPTPPRVIASRLSALAGAAVGLIESKSNLETDNQIMTKSDWTSIFTSSPSDFDFTIHLSPSVLPNNTKDKTTQFKNLQLAASLDVDTSGIDFVQSYISDLTAAFGNVAIFFYGAKYSGSDVIGGLWRPNVRGRETKPWKIRLGYSTVPAKMRKEDVVTNGNGDTEVEGVCKVNVEGMLAEMGMIGEGLVERIDIKSN